MTFEALAHEVTFAGALKHFLENGENGKTTTLEDMKSMILDKSERPAQIAELQSYGYKIKSL
jgi:hypothetical protein